MELLQVNAAAEYVIDDDRPTIDGDYIRGMLILGRESKNAFDASRTSIGTISGPRRKFNRVIDAVEEVAKFGDRPAYMLHKPAPRIEHDLLGTFENPRGTPKGLRADLKCRKMEGKEEFVPQAMALRDNVMHARPFGGFSPTFDFMVNPEDGEVVKILACESIDLVPQPATVRSAVESEEEPKPEPKEEKKKEEPKDDKRIEALEERVKAVESVVSAFKKSGSEQRSDPPPAPKVPTKANNFAQFVRE